MDPVPEDVPTPSLVTGWLALGLLDTSRGPWGAAQWLADGHDGEALRTLAGLEGNDSRAVRDVLADALADAGAPPLTQHDAARAAFVDLAVQLQTGRITELGVVRTVQRILTSTDYAGSVLGLPLGQTFGLDDEWDYGWGRSVDELGALIQTACREQLAAAES